MNNFKPALAISVLKAKRRGFQNDWQFISALLKKFFKLLYLFIIHLPFLGTPRRETLDFVFPVFKEAFINDMSGFYKLFYRLFGKKFIQIYERDGHRAGFSLFQMHALREIHLFAIALVAPFKGKGLAKAFLSESLDFWQARGFTTCSLKVKLDNHVAQNLYYSFGFRYVESDEETITMVKELSKQEKGQSMKGFLKKFSSIPKEERLNKVKRFLKNRILFSGLFRLVNRPSGSLYLSFRPNFHIDFNRFARYPESQKAWTRSLQYHYGDLARLYFLYANIDYCLSRNIPGDFAEVGVYKGNSAKIMQLFKQDRKLYLFDTFAGFSEQDLETEAPVIRKGTFDDVALKEVRDFIGKDDNVVICQGFFPDTAVLVPDGAQFAFVQLDCDLYAPTKAGCEFFYPRLSGGGVLVIHDYYGGHWPGVAKAVDEFFQDKPESPVLIPDRCGSIAIVKHKS